MGDYGIAQICLNGHVITTNSNDIHLYQKFCQSCGQTIISTCQNCNTPIKGRHREVSHIDPPFRYSTSPYFKPLYCYNCGEAFPWTQRTKEAAYDLVKFANKLSDTEKKDLKASISELIKDSPKTSIAQFKFKKYALKAGSEVAKGLKEILIDLVSETAKKAIWPS